MKAVHIKSFKHQRGLGVLQWLAVIVVVAVAGKFAFSAIPLYAENMYVQSALKSLDSDLEKFNNMTDAEIKKKLSNFYMINNVRSKGPTQNIKIVRESERVLITVDYETRVPYLLNIDLVVSFQNHLDSARPGQCCKPTASSLNK